MTLPRYNWLIPDQEAKLTTHGYYPRFREDRDAWYAFRPEAAEQDPESLAGTWLGPCTSLAIAVLIVGEQNDFIRSSFDDIAKKVRLDLNKRIYFSESSLLWGPLA